MLIVPALSVCSRALHAQGSAAFSAFMISAPTRAQHWTRLHKGKGLVLSSPQRRPLAVNPPFAEMLVISLLRCTSRVTCSTARRRRLCGRRPCVQYRPPCSHCIPPSPSSSARGPQAALMLQPACSRRHRQGRRTRSVHCFGVCRRLPGSSTSNSFFPGRRPRQPGIQPQCFPAVGQRVLSYSCVWSAGLQRYA